MDWYTSRSQLFDADDGELKVFTYVTGQRGNRKISCDGYTYICAKTIKNRKYWVCSKQRSRCCKARMITNLNETFFIKRNTIHSHGPDLTSSARRCSPV